MPTEVYKTLLRNSEGGGGGGRSSNRGGGGGSGSSNEVGRLVTHPSGKVLCPWCEHVMNTACCENWAICVKLVERLG